MIPNPMIFLVWITFILFTTPCFGNDSKVHLNHEELSWISQKHTVRVRIGSAPPFMITDGEPQGIAIDYLKSIFNRNGINYQYVTSSEVTWPQALKYIEQHEVVDMVPTAKITDDRQKRMLFTDEYLFAPWVIFTRSDADFVSSMEDLKGKTVSVEKGFVIHEKLKQQYPAINLNVVSTQLNNYAEMLLKDLSTGKVDAYIGNLLMTTYILQSKGFTNIKVAAPTPFDNHNQAMAIRNDWPELVSIINKTLGAMTPNEHAAIRNRWLAVRYEYGINKADLIRWILAIAGVSAFFVVFVLFWNKRLKSEIAFRMQIEEALRQNEQRYKIAQRMGQVGNWEFELETQLFWGSDEAKRIYGFDPESKHFSIEEVERCITERERAHQALVDLIEKNIPYNLEFEIRPVTGPATKIIRSVAEVIQDDGGVPIKVTGVIQDISKQKEAEKAMLNLERQLKQSQKMDSIGHLAGGIAHDFNNILSAIIGFTELALDDVEKETPLENNLQEVYIAGMRAKELVQQILAFARQADEERKPIRVAAVATEALKLLRSTIPTSIKIRQVIHSQSMIMGNSAQLHQVFMNLCTNAAHAMEDNGGELELCIRDVTIHNSHALAETGLKPGEYIEIKVSDTGVGIAPEIIDSIFNPYFSTKQFGEGTGMGLATVHGIVASYDGKISVESTKTKGAIFSVYLPITISRTAPQAHAGKALPTGNEHILLIDDEAPIARMASQILKRLGYRVTTQTSSLAALELFRSKPARFDLCISDMAMPDMTGDRLALEMLKIRPDMPIILCSGYSKRMSEGLAVSLGIKAFVYKPVVKADLAKTVREVLDKSTTVKS